MKLMRDSRRRRMILRDELEFDKSSSNGVESIHGDSSRPEFAETRQFAYTSGAQIENQPRLVDFVPTRIFLMIGLSLVLAAVLILLNIAHFKVLPFAEAQGISADSLELSLDRGLLSWTASFLLLATAFFCFQVFQVRRYRADDFAGSYRVWIWFAVGFVLASMDSTARISPICADLIATNWESGFLSSGENVWIILIGIPAFLVGIRLVIEIWRSRVAIGSIGMAALAYLTASVVRLDFFPVSSVEHSVVEGNSVLAAHSALFFAVVIYARFVLLESQGVIRASYPAEMTTEMSQSEPLITGEITHLAQSLVSGPQSNGSDQSASSGQKNGEDQKADIEELESDKSGSKLLSLRLMGQEVQKRKGIHRKKEGQSSRRRAA